MIVEVGAEGQLHAKEFLHADEQVGALVALAPSKSPADLPKGSQPEIAKRRRTDMFAPMKLLERITVNPEVMTGKPCIRGMRVTVSTILGLLATGAARGEILRSYPFLEEADIDACLAYAA